MKKLISKLAVIIMCVIVSCMSLGTGIVANAASDDPSTIAKNVSLPANNKAVKMGQCVKLFVTASDNYSTIIAKKTKYDGFSKMNVRLYRKQTSGTLSFLSAKKTISPKSTQQKITYATGLKYAKNDGIIFEGSQSEAKSKGAYVVLYGN